MAEQATAGNETRQKAGKYLTFRLADEEFGLEILKVREIIGMMDITAVPLTPAHVKGVVNLRGRVIPVMDLRAKFGMPPTQRSPSTCIIVVHVGKMEIGTIVDSVSEVLDIAGADIEETPSFGPSADTRFIVGIGKTGGRVTLLLDIDKVLTDEEMHTLAATAPLRNDPRIPR